MDPAAALSINYAKTVILFAHVVPHFFDTRGAKSLMGRTGLWRAVALLLCEGGDPMQDIGATGDVVVSSPGTAVVEVVAEAETVSTHVLVAEEQVAKLRELSRRTRVAQSEYLREAVDDLLQKYADVGEKR